MTLQLQALSGQQLSWIFRFQKVTRVCGQKELQSELRLFDLRQRREGERGITGFPSVFLHWQPKGFFSEVIMFPSCDDTSPLKTTKQASLVGLSLHAYSLSPKSYMQS